MKAVQVGMARSERSLTGVQGSAAPVARSQPILLANPVLGFFRRQIDTAVALAKKTRHGLPNDVAILHRWWISDYRPARGDRSKLGRLLYAGSFECCCELLDLDVDAERKRVLAEIDDCIVREMVLYAGNATYERRAAVLRCAGVPTAVGRQYVLGLVDPEEYADVADPDEARALALAMRREARAAARVGKRSRRTKAGVATKALT